MNAFEVDIESSIQNTPLVEEAGEKDVQDERFEPHNAITIAKRVCIGLVGILLGVLTIVPNILIYQILELFLQTSRQL